MNNIISTKVNIFRNLKDYKFVSKIALEHKEEIIQKMDEILKTKYALVNVSSADINVIKYLKNNDLISNQSVNVFTAKKENLCIRMFEGEHLHIVSTCDGYDKNIFKQAKALADELANKIELAFNDEYGYLMSDISKIGTGIQLECKICLHSIKELNKIEQVKQNIRQLGFFLNETNKPSIYKLSTACNLGYSEKEVFEEFDKMVAKLQDLEVESAKMLDVTNHDVIMDRTLRSVAIAKSAYLMTYDELFNLLINLRTGINLGIITITSEDIIKLQQLIKDKNSEFVSQSETKELAEKVKNILKGE